MSLGWHLFRQLEIENKGFFKSDTAQVCVLKDLGLPYCVMVDGKVVVGKRYDRRSIQEPMLLEKRVGVKDPETDGVIDGCLRVRK